MKKIVLALLFCAIVVACKKHEDGIRQDNEVWLHNNVIEPYQLKVSKGATIIFINKDAKNHTASELNNKFYSGKLKPGDSFSYTFNDTGYYAFICNYQNSMLGQIIVK